MNERWNWLVRYAVVMVVALVLGAALGAMDLFKETRLLGKGLTASHLVRALGFGAALALLWIVALRATPQLREQGPRWRFVHASLLPLATLIVAASAHAVLLLVLSPLMDRTLHQIYDWLFIAGIVGSATWLLVALFQESAN